MILRLGNMILRLENITPRPENIILVAENMGPEGISKASCRLYASL